MAETTVPTKAAEETAPPATRETARYLVPPVDIYETEEGLTVMADLPGVSKDDIDVRVEEHVLTIHGRVRETPAGDRTYEEFRLNDFYRQFQLDEEVDQEKITAEIKNGVLKIFLPKHEKAKPKQIAVKVG